MKTTTMRIFPALAALLVLLPAATPESGAQDEAASYYRRYKEYESSSGYYEEYEVYAGRRTPLVGVPGVSRGRFPYSPTAAKVRIRSRLPDAHQGIKFYDNLRCQSCHAGETRDIHTVRAKLTCRQCHGGEPISGIEHTFSPLNPIRRHAYVCAKCHQGAGASFASYIIHSPNPALAGTLKTFPLFAYVFWFMIALAAGTFALFLPHTFMWGLRELFAGKKKKEDKH
jgi:hypothetical protein